jgi:hypothetical protein
VSSKPSVSRWGIEMENLTRSPYDRDHGGAW